MTRDDLDLSLYSSDKFIYIYIYIYILYMGWHEGGKLFLFVCVFSAVLHFNCYRCTRYVFDLWHCILFHFLPLTKLLNICQKKVLLLLKYLSTI